jgi:hypothetical protein
MKFINRTATCLNADYTQCHPYLLAVEDPISAWQLPYPECNAINNGNASVDDPGTPVNEIGKVWGMSQKGAIRWSKGNHCAAGGDLPWPVRWDDYRQILVHYYTGIDILDGNGNSLAPNDRWNLLWHNNFGFPVGETPNLNNAQTYPLQLQLQNTSVSNWAENEITLGYQWTPQGVDPDPAKWLELAPLPELAKGDSTPNRDNSPFIVAIPAPSGAGSYTLHLDTGRNGAWFSMAGWPDARIDVTVQLTTPPTPSMTPTSIPSPTPTLPPTATPAPTATPWWGWWVEAEEAALQEESPIVRQEYSTLLSRVRDEIMRPDPKGDAYIRLVYRHAPEITALLLSDATLRQDTRTLMLEVRPLLEEMLANKTNGQRLSADWVKRTLALLSRLEKKASPELKQEIIWWRAWLPRFAGKNGREIWEMLPPRDAGKIPQTAGSPEELVLQSIPAEEARAFGSLLSRVRDEVMRGDKGGEVYIALVYRYTPEVTALLLNDETLRQQAESLLLEAEPGLQSLLGETKDEWVFSSGWLKRMDALLAALQIKGTPDLRAELAIWRTRLPEWEDKTPSQVWEALRLTANSMTVTTPTSTSTVTPTAIP